MISYDGRNSRLTVLEPSDVHNKSMDCVSILFEGRGEGSIPTQTQSAKICPNLHLGGGDGAGGPDQLKPKVPRSVQICIWGRGCPDQHS